MPTISMIVPVINEYRALKMLLNKLSKNSAELLSQIEILICDGGSTDLSAALVRRLQKKLPYLNLHFLCCPKGRAIQMSKGAEQAKGEVLFFLHADSVLPEQWYVPLRQAEWGRFNVSLSGDKIAFRMIAWMMNWRSCLTQVVTGDQGIFIKKHLYHAVGGWDRIPLMEDISMSKKLRKLAKVTCVKQSLITSSRRWERDGISKTIVLMWWLRLLFVLGVSAKTLHRYYYPDFRQKAAIVLQVFSKLPVQGCVKTRLIPDLGVKKATQLHQYLLDQCLARCAQFKADLQLWLAPYDEDEPSQKLYQSYALHTQQGGDLGSRMSHAIQHGLQGFDRVILMGTDQLGIDDQVLQSCETALDTFEVAIVPAEDGGFVAIACRVFDERFFADITWSTSQVLAQLKQNLESLDVLYQLLNPVRDIDTIDDVAHYPELTQ